MVQFNHSDLQRALGSRVLDFGWSVKSQLNECLQNHWVQLFSWASPLLCIVYRILSPYKTFDLLTFLTIICLPLLAVQVHTQALSRTDASTSREEYQNLHEVIYQVYIVQTILRITHSPQSSSLTVLTAESWAGFIPCVRQLIRDIHVWFWKAFISFLKVFCPSRHSCPNDWRKWETWTCHANEVLETLRVWAFCCFAA